MRLLHLKIRNIASLKGEHEIDFLEIQRGSSLFAITGETGSGKSTILNSIGLALYGEIYKKNMNQLDVVTLGEKEGSIELIFQVKDKYYLADWRARVLKQNGEPYSTPQSPTRNLYQLQGTEYSSAKTISNKTCSELLNLDFDQFCRCIILNQGEFAKFLNSTFKDRRDILEKLYPGEMLDNISRELESEKKGLEKIKHDLEIELHTLKGDNLSGNLLKEHKAILEAELKSLEAQNKLIENLDYHFISLFSYHEKYSDNEAKKRKIKSDMALETTKYNHLLHLSGAIHENFLNSRKAQESELPLLQTYLKKEETLKLLDESWIELKKTSDKIFKDLTALETKLKSDQAEEESSQTRLKSSQADLRFPLITLKSAGPHFELLFEVFGEKELILEELKGKKERLGLLEGSGKELNGKIEEIENQLKMIPKDIKSVEKEFENKRANLSLKIDQKQRAEIKSQELKKSIEVSTKELVSLKKKRTDLVSLMHKTQEEIFPLETTLKLQEILNAKEICVDHALSAKVDNCPVCEQEVDHDKWSNLKERLASTDLNLIRARFDESNKVIFKCQKEDELYQLKIKEEEIESHKKELEYKALARLRDELLPTLLDLDQSLSVVQKQSWQLDSLTKNLNDKKTERQKAREIYSKLKSEISDKEILLTNLDEKLKSCEAHFKDLYPVVNRETIRELKIEERNFKVYSERQMILEKVVQEKSYTLQQISRETSDLKILEARQQEQMNKIDELKAQLTEVLKGEKASLLIAKINQAAKLATEAWERQIDEQKKQELILKDSQGRLSQLDELTKDYELQFFKELQLVNEIAANESLKLELIRFKNLELNLSSPKELLIPLQDLLAGKKENNKFLTNQCRMNFASASSRLADWERLQDKIKLLELKARDINDSLSRKMRLFEVLGKDELRTFVLSLVEENLIQQTNDELQKLCQGRYEIVHQTRSLKMTPEFFILDKFREGGKRKVSTLSGGETFMVSLAMALGLAEMTRGQAEIDSLFIDEGFGTLDQESLEDVLDMLQQIQTRGLMVGIISHIKTLTSALPVNLLLRKKADGTSSISLHHN